MSQPPTSPSLCPQCEVMRGSPDHSDPAVQVHGAFVVHRKIGPAAVPGWMVVAPRRHVEQVDDLTPDEQAALGPLVSAVARAMRTVTRCEKVYVALFAEVLPHLHIHIIARPHDLPASLRGPALFTAPGCDDATVDETTDRVLALLHPRP